MPAFEWQTNATRDTVRFVVRRNTKHKKDENKRIEQKRQFE